MSNCFGKFNSEFPFLLQTEMAAAGMGILYSTSFLQAGFLGLGALWLASYLGHGGYGGHGALKRTAAFGYGDPYGGHGGYGGYGGYGDYGGGGGYGPHHGGYGAPTPYHRSDSHMADSKLPPWPPSPFKRKKRYVGAELEDVYWHEGGIKEEELMVSTAHDLDSDKCGLRLVCELAAIRNRNLSPDEQDILDFVR